MATSRAPRTVESVAVSNTFAVTVALVAQNRFRFSLSSPLTGTDTVSKRCALILRLDTVVVKSLIGEGYLGGPFFTAAKTTWDRAAQACDASQAV